MDFLIGDVVEPIADDMARNKRAPDYSVVDGFVVRLRAAACNRDAFDEVMSELEAIRRTHVPEIIRIAHLYVSNGKGTAPASGASALAHLKKRFRERLHEDKGASRHHS